MLSAYDKVCSTVEVEVAWLEKLNEEKCDIDKVVSRLKRDARIFKRNLVDAFSDSHGYEMNNTEVVKDIQNAISEIEELNALTKTYKRMMIRLFNNVKTKAYERRYSYTSTIHITRCLKETMKEIRNTRCIGNRKLNLFFPNIKNQDASKDIDREIFNIYASSENERIYSKLKGKVDYRILGSLIMGARISNNFDVVVSTPSFLTNDNRSIEKAEILNVMRYLRNGGLFVLVLPYAYFSDDLLMILSKRFINTDFAVIDKESSTVMFTGTKAEFKNNNDSSVDYHNLLSYIDKDYDELVRENNKIDFSKYCVPEVEAEIAFFRGSKISKEEMCNYCSESGLVDDFLNEEETIEVKDTRPLLPFNIGQVGLVLTSSQLNGIVNDENGIPHLIKGMTVKDTNRSEEHIGDEIKSTEIVANRVQINIMSADGEIIKIS